MSEFIPQIGATTEDTVKMLLEQLTWVMRKLDSKNVKRIDTNETHIKSAEGETEITGPLLMMYDKQDPPRLRLKMGYDTATSKFIFQMYDALGNLTLSENDAGEAVFSGNIATLKDVHIGNNLYLGDRTQQGISKNIIFNDAALIYYYFLEGVGPAIAINGAVFDIIVSVVYAAGNWFFSGNVYGLESSGWAKTSDISTAIAQHVIAFHS
jgi:hypothetical protein